MISMMQMQTDSQIITSYKNAIYSIMQNGIYEILKLKKTAI